MQGQGRPRIVIVGCGFGGLFAARELRRAPADVLVIDHNNFHLFQPLLYQVASAALAPADIAQPIRTVLRHQANASVMLGEVDQANLGEQYVLAGSSRVPYDYLILAPGAVDNYFGHKEWHAFAPGMKEVEDATLIRSRMLLSFETAEIESDPEERAAHLAFVIVGGGPTGVELAGAMAEMKKYILPKDYPGTDFSRLCIYLLEGSPHTLNAMSNPSKEKSQQYLEELGVKVMTGTVVEDYDGTTVRLKGGQTIAARNVIWAAGVTGNVLEGIPASSVVRGNRMKTNRYNEVEGLKDIYAIGDIAWMPTPKYPNGHPQLAAAAIDQGLNVGHNFRRMSKGRPLVEYEYRNKGSMATVGKRKAVVDLPGFSFQGLFAWLTWMFVHLMLILSVKNRLFIFLNWMMSYFANDSTLRLMLKAKEPKD